MNGHVVWVRARIVLPCVLVMASACGATLHSNDAAAADGRASGLAITSIVPSHAKAGQTVTVSGRGFRHVSEVLINGSRSTYRTLSSGQIDVKVPAAATSGRVAVRAGTTTTVSRSVLALSQTVTTFSPTSGDAGTAVSVSGSGFVKPCLASFGGVQAPCRVVSSVKIATEVPPNATTGLIAVTIGSSTASSPTYFTVPLSLVLSATSGTPSSVITVSGSGFSAKEAVDLYLGTTDEAVVSTSATGSFSYQGFAIPSSSQPGTQWITAIGRRSGLSAQDAFDVSTNWSQFGFGSASQRDNPYEDTLNTTNAAQLGLAWKFTTDGSVPSSPAVVDGIVYVGSDDGNVYAINATTGAKVWSFSTGGEVQSSPAVVNGRVYVGSNNGFLYALNASTGAMYWSFETTAGDPVASPVVQGGVVFVGSEDGHFYALNATTGVQRWSVTTPSGISAAPAVANGIVYIASGNGFLYALNASTGAEIWLYYSGSQVYTPAVVDGIVYFTSYNGDVQALNASSDVLLWSDNTGGTIDSSPAVADGVVYVATATTHEVLALNSLTGTQVWSYDPGDTVTSSPSVANGVVYFGCWNANVYALAAATGAVLWDYPTGSEVGSSAAVANGVVYIGSQDATLYAFDLEAGLTSSNDVRINPGTLHPDRSLHLTG
jgi:outer membrane protein assembly factor BamB